MEQHLLLKTGGIVDDDNKEIDLDFGDPEEMLFYQTPSFRKDSVKLAKASWKIWPWLINIILLTISVSFFIEAVIIRASIPVNCLEARLQWSITMGSIPEEHHYQRFFGSFDRSSSPYKGPPSPAVDAAWSNLTNYGAMRISEEAFQKLNASKNSVKVPESYGGGRLAFLESIHQLHCLEYIWKHTYPDYYVEIAEKIRINDIRWHEHMDHCADMLRQKLMCDADVHVLTYNWIKGHDAPHPNFNVPRQCRNFEVIKQYALANALDGSELPRNYFEKPKDGSVKEYEVPPFDPFDDGWPSH